MSNNESAIADWVLKLLGKKSSSWSANDNSNPVWDGSSSSESSQASSISQEELNEIKTTEDYWIARCVLYKQYTEQVKKKEVS